MLEDRNGAGHWVVLVGRAILAIGLGASPAVGNKLQAVPLVWPPVGSLTFAADVAAIFVSLFGLLPFVIKTKRRAKFSVIGGVAAAIVALVTYGYLLDLVVVQIPTRHAGVQYRTVGSEKTQECLAKFPGKSDEEILEGAGLNDGDIERMWTPASVRRNRLELFLAYVALLSSLNFAVGALGPFLKKA